MAMPIDEEIRCIIADVLGLEASLIGADAGIAQTPGWDADRHLAIVIGVERSFAMDFDFAEVQAMTTFPAIVDHVAAKL